MGGAPVWLTERIERDARYLARRLAENGIDERVIAAMARVPRHEFVPSDLVAAAYADAPVPIGHGQTISQPSLVALMTDVLQVEDSSIVLEVGTGSGYQAAILAELAKEVYSVEIVEPLATAAAARLRHLGYVNVHVRCGNGYLGWPEHAPYDAICVTASAPEVPPPLLAQLGTGGRMIIPVGGELILLENSEDGAISSRMLCEVAFVPLTGVPHRP